MIHFSQSTLFVFDLDGTLLSKDGELSDYTRSVLKQMVDHQIKFTVASARSLPTIQSMFDGIPLEFPVAQQNGSLLTDPQSNENLHVGAIKANIARELFEEGLKRGMPPVFSTITDDAAFVYHGEPVNEAIQWFLDDRDRHKDPRLHLYPEDHSEIFGKQVISLTFMASKDELDELQTWMDWYFQGQIYRDLYENRYQLGWYWMSIHGLDAEKGKAISKLRERMGDQIDQVVAFGDADNDISLFKIADYGVAVDNAIDEIKQLADVVIDHHDTDSVARFLAEQVLSD